MGCFPRLYQLLDHILQLLSQEDGNNGRRRFVCAESVIISHIRRALTQQIRMGVHSLDDAGQHQQELNIFVGGFSGIQQVYTVVGSQGPVIMFARTVHTGERLLMQQAGHPMAARYLFQRFHHQLIVIYRNIGRLIHRSQFMLRRRNLVVLGPGSYSQLPQLYIEIFHIRTHSLPDGTEVMILQLLSLRRRRPEQGTSCKNQIITL